MKRIAIAGFAAGAAMMIGGALGAVSQIGSAEPKPLPDATTEIMNPMVAGQAMLASRNLLENISVSPDHTVLTAAMKNSGLSDALKADGQFTVFAPTNKAQVEYCWNPQTWLSQGHWDDDPTSWASRNGNGHAAPLPAPKRKLLTRD